jgi:hypothetical protein
MGRRGDIWPSAVIRQLQISLDFTFPPRRAGRRLRHLIHVKFATLAVY